MSIPAIQQQADMQLKVVNLNTDQAINTGKGVASSKIFTISFSYEKKAYRTKVMKVLYARNDAMYKVVMPCSLNNGVCVHWLQRHDDEWTVIMGEPLDGKLFKALTSAIATLE
ncbi:hypothetical protein [Mucilaginibacter pedocola]|uniref:Uncharacterized protein n=1 Tax=Mucilaginibacter pedocola TaxID=1792845 RepID=A0A1S9PKT5_9SPHI|nr:hypothetical protein [Mucilaginibacter pedocola]OOQ61576.1 hypothetical protein BC343_00415 [Mucilaginibacter pedocola]